MIRKKTIFYILLIALVIIASVTQTYVQRGFNKVYYILFDQRTNSFPIGLVYIAIFASVSGFIVLRYNLKKWIIVPMVLVFLSLYVVKDWMVYTKYHDNPELMSDVRGPFCLFEYNFDSYWDFLTKGCHISFTDFIVGLVYKAVCWTLVFLLVHWFIQRRTKATTQQLNSELIDY